MSNIDLKDISSLLGLAESKTDFRVQEALFERYMRQPYRGTHYCIVLLTKGAIIHDANLERFVVEEGMITLSTPGTIQQWGEPSPNLKGYSILFTADFYDSFGYSNARLTDYLLFQWNAQHYIAIDELKQAEFVIIIQKIIQEQEFQQRGYRAVIQSYLNIILTMIDRHCENSVASNNKPTSINSLATRFKRLVSSKIKSNLSVQDYAKILHVTSKYLSQVVKASSGQPASMFIQKMVILEAKVMLRQTSLTVAEIGAELNFWDASYFSRYFKRNTGLTPTQYRKAVGNDTTFVPGLSR